MGLPLGLPAPDPDHADRVYQLHELEELIARSGLPSGAAPEDPAGYAGHQHRRVDTYIEIQLWSDEPVRDHLARP